MLTCLYASGRWRAPCERGRKDAVQGRRSDAANPAPGPRPVEYAVSGITAVLGVTLFVQEAQRIREPPFCLVNYEYLALLAVTGALVFLWIWGSEELEMLGRWLDPEEFPAS